MEKKAKLLFVIPQEFDITTNEQLKKLGVFKLWDHGFKRNLFAFPFENLTKVKNLVGPISFDEEEIKGVLRQTRQDIVGIEKDPWRGVSGYEILEFPKIYQIKQYQRATKGGKPTPRTYSVPKERVVEIWNEVILKLEKDKFVEGIGVVAMLSCKHFGLDRYFYDGGKFRKNAFYGSQTVMHSDYRKFYHLPLVVLEEFGVIERSGRFVKRIADVWEEQRKIEVTI